MPLPCVILAGGLGTRMRPVTERIPKALIPVAGRPFADLQLERLREQGVEHVIYSVGFLGEQLREHVGDGSRHGLRVDYVTEGSELRGTGGALRLVVESGLAGESFSVLFGDALLALDVSTIESRFARSGHPALMTVLRNENRWEMSNAIVRDGLVVLYDKARPEKRRREMRWIDYGFSILKADAVRRAVPPAATADMADMMRDLSVAGRLAAFEVQQRFFEVGSAAGLADLERYLLTGDVEVNPA